MRISLDEVRKHALVLSADVGFRYRSTQPTSFLCIMSHDYPSGTLREQSLAVLERS